MEPSKVYKNKNARDVVFFCMATKTDGTAVGYYLNSHYFEKGYSNRLLLCTDDIFTINLDDSEWTEFNTEGAHFDF